jgi:hypothetical protein
MHLNVHVIRIQLIIANLQAFSGDCVVVLPKTEV